MSTATLALIIFGVILAQVAALVLFRFFRRKRQYRDLDLRQNESQVALPQAPSGAKAVSEPSTAVPAWEGFKDFVVQRRVMEGDGETICSFYLVPADGQPLPPFKPGQFLTFRLQIEDKTVIRCYSLSDRPRADYYRVTIKRVPPPAVQPDLPPGRSSNFFHDFVREGTRIAVKAPSGHFHLMETDPLPVVLIGGGIGITPILSILNMLLHGDSPREIWLFYGIRNNAEHVMKEHLDALQKAHPNFHLYVCYSRPDEKDVEGVNYQHRGRVNVPLLRATLKLMRYQFYICGPKPMMENLVPELEEWGVDSGDIYYESFGPASLIKHEKPKPAPEGAAVQPITVTFSKSDKSIPWDAGADSLLEFAEAKGIEVESGCRAGSCGCCQTALESGEVEHNQQPDADVEPGHCLLCISIPKGDLKLIA